MVKKNYSCESSDSCSLVSVTGISAGSSCSESSSSTTRSSSNDSSTKNLSSTNSSSTESSSCSSPGSSSCSSSGSSDQTYSDNSTCRTSSNTDTCSSSSSTKESGNCDDQSSNKCEKQCYNKCEKLVKKYNNSKEELVAISDIIVVLNFIKSKLIAVQPNIDLRHVEKYTVEENINWVECFVDTLFCVLRKNEAYKIIKVKDCKLKNDSSDVTIDNRTYLIKIKYNSKSGEVCRNIPLVFEWNQLTNNESKSFKGILNIVVKQIDNYIKGYQAASTIPFLC
jgi:hypothetical protein